MAKMHYFGKRIDGELCVFNGGFEDDEFVRLTRNGLPAGWVAWHFEDGEDWDRSERVKLFRKRPVILDNCGQLVAFRHDDSSGLECPLPLADPIKLLELAMGVA